MVDAQVSKTCGDNTPCEFESRPGHLLFPLGLPTVELYSFSLEEKWNTF